MAANSHVRYEDRKHLLPGTPLPGLRASGTFARWPLIGITLFLLGSLMFGALAYSVETNGALLQWDDPIAQALQPDRLHIPSGIMEYVIFGFFIGREIVVILATILALYFIHKHYWRELMMVLWGPGLGGLLWFALSRFFDRPRPPAQLDVLMLTVPSFPSGHAVSAVLGYGLLAYLLIPNLPNRFWKWTVAVSLVLLTLFVGVSRLLVGGHYFSDVIAGYAVGIAWAGVVYTLAERLFPREPSAAETKRTDGGTAGLRSPGWFADRPVLGISLVLLGSLILAVLGYNLLTKGPLVAVDQSLYETLIVNAKSASPSVNEFMLFGFFVGKQVILILVTLFSIYFLYKRFWMELAMLLISSAGGSFVWNWFVNYFARPRPAEQTGLQVRSIPSFPSGHAMSAMIFYGFLAYLLIPKMPSLFWKWMVGIAAVSAMLFDGFSRIYQGSHYLTDVLAGYALGLAWAALVYTLIEIIFMRRKV